MRLTFAFSVHLMHKNIHDTDHPWHTKSEPRRSHGMQSARIFAESRSRPINTGFFNILSQQQLHTARCSPTFNTSPMLSAAFIYFAANCEINMREALYEICIDANAEPASIKFYFAHFSLNVAKVNTWIFGAGEYWERIVDVCTQCYRVYVLKRRYIYILYNFDRVFDYIVLLFYLERFLIKAWWTSNSF